jgi:tetratricopeptide (TPR) repeat protein
MLDLAGDLSGNPRDIHLLDPAAALTHYREALRIAELDYARDTQSATARRNVDRMLRKNAIMLVDSNPEQAMVLTKRALQLSEIHLKSSPRSPEYTRDRVDGILIYGYGLQNLKRHQEALAYLQNGLTEQLQVERFSPDAKRFQRELQETYEALGDTHLALGDQLQALAHYEKGRERTVALLWDRPTDAYLKRDLADSDEKIAGIYAVMARKPTSESRTQWQQAIEYQKRSVDTWSKWPREVAPSAFQKMREQRARQLLDAYQREASKSL